MNRPSHWLAIFFAVLLVGLWTTDRLEPLVRGPEGMAAIAADATQTRTVRLKHSQRPKPVLSHVEGAVVDALGWPLSRVVVEGSDGSRTETDAAGRFRLPFSGRNASWVRVDSEAGEGGARMLPGLPATIVVARRAPWLAPVATPASALQGEGRVVGPSGDEMAGVLVAVRETGATARADENGRFRIPLPTTPCHLIAWDESGLASETSFRAGREQGLVPLPDLGLARGFSVRGMLRGTDDAPRSGAVVLVERDGFRRSARTDAQGAFSVDGLPAGDYRIQALPCRGELGFFDQLQVGMPGDVDRDWQMQAHRPLALALVDGAQEPRAGAHVLAHDGQRQAYAQADDAGRLQLVGLDEGPYEFEVREGEAFDALEVLDFDPATARLAVSAQVAGK